VRRDEVGRAYGDDGGVLGDTVELTGDGAGDVGAVTVAILVVGAVIREADAPLGTSAELDVGRLDATGVSCRVVCECECV
jgi:hypothetical protein